MLLKAGGPRYVEKGLQAVFFLCAAISTVTTVAVIAILATETWSFLQQLSLIHI